MVDIAHGYVYAQLRVNLTPTMLPTDTAIKATSNAMKMVLASRTGGKLGIYTPGPIVLRNVTWAVDTYYLVFVAADSTVDAILDSHVLFYTTLTAATSATNEMLAISYPENLVVEI